MELGCLHREKPNLFVPAKVEGPVGPGKRVKELPKVEADEMNTENTDRVAREEIARTRTTDEVIRQGVVAQSSVEPLCRVMIKAGIAANKERAVELLEINRMLKTQS